MLCDHAPWASIREIAAATREILGGQRLAWLSELPHVRTFPPIALVHASPESCWRTPAIGASDAGFGVDRENVALRPACDAMSAVVPEGCIRRRICNVT